MAIKDEQFDAKMSLFVFQRESKLARKHADLYGPKVTDIIKFIIVKRTKSINKVR